MGNNKRAEYQGDGHVGTIYDSKESLVSKIRVFYDKHTGTYTLTIFFPDLFDGSNLRHSGLEGAEYIEVPTCGPQGRLNDNNYITSIIAHGDEDKRHCGLHIYDDITVNDSSGHVHEILYDFTPKTLHCTFTNLEKRIKKAAKQSPEFAALIKGKPVIKGSMHDLVSNYKDRLAEKSQAFSVQYGDWDWRFDRDGCYSEGGHIDGNVPHYREKWLTNYHSQYLPDSNVDNFKNIYLPVAALTLLTGLLYIAYSTCAAGTRAATRALHRPSIAATREDEGCEQDSAKKSKAKAD